TLPLTAKQSTFDTIWPPPPTHDAFAVPPMPVVSVLFLTWALIAKLSAAGKQSVFADPSASIWPPPAAESCCGLPAAVGSGINRTSAVSIAGRSVVTFKQYAMIALHFAHSASFSP